MCHLVLYLVAEVCQRPSASKVWNHSITVCIYTKRVQQPPVQVFWAVRLIRGTFSERLSKKDYFLKKKNSDWKCNRSLFESRFLVSPCYVSCLTTSYISKVLWSLILTHVCFTRTLLPPLHVINHRPLRLFDSVAALVRSPQIIRDDGQKNNPVLQIKNFMTQTIYCLV